MGRDPRAPSVHTSSTYRKQCGDRMNSSSNAARLIHETQSARKQRPGPRANGQANSDEGWHVFGPELILPVQYAQARNAEGRCAGERRLMLAVLEDAVVTLKTHLRGPSVHSRRIVAEIENWLASGSTAHTFAFATICDVLGFDVFAVRQAIKEWTRADAADPRYRRMYSGPGRQQINVAVRRRRHASR